MTDKTYIKAEEIFNQLKDLKNLRHITFEPHKRFCLRQKFLYIADFDETELCLCDEGLNNVIRDYCDKRIKELEDELESL